MMGQSFIEGNLAKIRAYSHQFSEFADCHHFLYDRRYDGDKRVEFALMGINPGETEADREVWPRERGWTTEETSASEFGARLKPSRSAKVWRTKCQNMLGLNVLLAELFFWSTPTVAD